MPWNHDDPHIPAGLRAALRETRGAGSCPARVREEGPGVLPRAERRTREFVPAVEPVLGARKRPVPLKRVPSLEGRSPVLLAVLSAFVTLWEFSLTGNGDDRQKDEETLRRIQSLKGLLSRLRALLGRLRTITDGDGALVDADETLGVIQDLLDLLENLEATGGGLRGPTFESGDGEPVTLEDLQNLCCQFDVLTIPSIRSEETKALEGFNKLIADRLKALISSIGKDLKPTSLFVFNACPDPKERVIFHRVDFTVVVPFASLRKEDFEVLQRVFAIVPGLDSETALFSTLLKNPEIFLSAIEGLKKRGVEMFLDFAIRFEISCFRTSTIQRPREEVPVAPPPAVEEKEF